MYPGLQAQPGLVSDFKTGLADEFSAASTMGPGASLALPWAMSRTLSFVQITSPQNFAVDGQI